MQVVVTVIIKNEKKNFSVSAGTNVYLWYRMILPPDTKVPGSFHAPQKYRNKSGLVLMLELVPDHLGPGTFEMD